MLSAPLAVMPFDPMIVNPAMAGIEPISTTSASAIERRELLYSLRSIKHKPSPRSGQDSSLLAANSARDSYQRNRDSKRILKHWLGRICCVQLAFVFLVNRCVY